jgi:hypothetical protein
MFILFFRKCGQYCPNLKNNCPHFLGSLECSCVDLNVHTIFQKMWTILSILKYNCPHFLGFIECSYYFPESLDIIVHNVMFLSIFSGKLYEHLNMFIRIGHVSWHLLNMFKYNCPQFLQNNIMVPSL